MKKIIIVVLLTIFVFACEHHSNADQIITETTDSKYQHIIEYAKKHETLRLIISYETEDLTDKPDREIITIIHNQGFQILKSIPSATLLRQYDTAPAIAVIIHKNDLDTLILNPKITTIQLDSLAKPM